MSRSRASRTIGLTAAGLLAFAVAAPVAAAEDGTPGLAPFALLLVALGASGSLRLAGARARS